MGTGLVSVEEAYAHGTKDVPLGRPVDPEEVTAVMAYLCSSKASIIKSAALTADGGSTIADRVGLYGVRTGPF